MDSHTISFINIQRLIICITIRSQIEDENLEMDRSFVAENDSREDRSEFLRSFLGCKCTFFLIAWKYRDQIY